jgi:hypothetical protein
VKKPGNEPTCAKRRKFYAKAPRVEEGFDNDPCNNINTRFAGTTDV